MRLNNFIYMYLSTTGKDLKCEADIVKDLPTLEKPTPAMLLTAQACVARSMEEQWLVFYNSENQYHFTSVENMLF